jgi:prepilin-type N-terminal cleavage/methylation domain-containing protein/prepilin-type processing-associated H-X9-DG protein
MSRAGFTLIELLVVVSIIAVLASILLSAIGPVRNAAYTIVCQSNLRQLGVAFNSYVEDWQRLPAAVDDGYSPNRTWRELTVTDMAAPELLTQSTITRCPSKAGRRDQHAHLAGTPARWYGMNLALGPILPGPPALDNHRTYKDPTSIKFHGLAALLLETRHNLYTGGYNVVYFGNTYLNTSEDFTRHQGGSNILYLDFRVEKRQRNDIPRSATVEADKLFWRGIK